MKTSMAAVVFCAALASACAQSETPEDVRTDASSKGGGSSGKDGSIGSLDSGTDGWATGTGGTGSDLDAGADSSIGTGGTDAQSSGGATSTGGGGSPGCKAQGQSCTTDVECCSFSCLPPSGDPTGALTCA